MNIALIMFIIDDWNVAYFFIMAIVVFVSSIPFLAFSITGAKVQAYLNADDLRVTGGMLDVRIPYRKMDRMELRNGIDYGGRVAGYAGSDIIGGFFHNKEFGTYRVGAYLSTPVCVVVSYGKKTLVFNFDSSTRTEQFYQDLIIKNGTKTTLPPNGDDGKGSIRSVV